MNMVMKSVNDKYFKNINKLLFFFLVFSFFFLKFNFIIIHFGSFVGWMVGVVVGFFFVKLFINFFLMKGSLSGYFVVLEAIKMPV